MKTISLRALDLQRAVNARDFHGVIQYRDSTYYLVGSAGRLSLGCSFSDAIHSLSMRDVAISNRWLDSANLDPPTVSESTL